MSRLGNIYGLLALGATAVGPDGNVIAAANTIPTFGFPAQVQAALLKSDDAKFMLSALWTITGAARSLSKLGRLPVGYEDFCGNVLKRVREIYPATTASCDAASQASEQDSSALLALGGKVTDLTMTKKVQPIYPQAAKSKGIQGTMLFSAVINAAGKIEQLDLTSGIFALYPATLQAVKQWQYMPATLDNKPIPVTTEIKVNFAMGR